MFIHFLCLFPLRLAIMLNFNISKVVFFQQRTAPGDRAVANPGAIPELLTRTRFPIRI